MNLKIQIKKYFHFYFHKDAFFKYRDLSKNTC